MTQHVYTVPYVGLCWWVLARLTIVPMCILSSNNKVYDHDDDVSVL